MQRTKRMLAGALALLVGAGAALAQGGRMFTDVEPGHWAYEAIRRAVEAGVLEGVDGKFMGQKLITRHQMAVIVAKLLDRIDAATSGEDPGTMRKFSRMSGRDVANLEALTIEFADELALMNVKVSTLEDAFVELKNTVEALKAGAVVEDHPHGPTTQLAGLLSFGLVSTDDQIGASPSLSRYSGTPDNFFFTVPQASLSLDLDLGQGVGTHVQFDYGTDGASAAGPPGVASVQLNEAYFTWDNGPGPLGLKAGFFALPYQSWEFNGPQRTLMHSITPSKVNWFWETNRVVGLEAQRSVNQTADSWKWRAGLFTGNDNAGVIGAGPATGRVYGNRLTGSLDTNVSGSGTATLEDTPGYYFDVESGTTGNFGWRLGYFDVGGDNTATAPLTATNEMSAFQLGGWYRGDKWNAMAQAVFGSEDYGAGAANADDFLAYYASFRYDLDRHAERSVFLRYDSVEVDNQAAGTGVFPGGDREVTGFTLAYNHKVTDTSLFQFEYLVNDEDVATGSSDVNDDLVQARYKIWW